ncbi:MAG: serine protease [Spirochaetes bacterium]|nr:serine protease [Spirochaetota bacterium]
MLKHVGKNSYAVWLFAFVLLFTSNSTAISQRSVAHILEKATVKVSTYDGERLVTYGSGFLISENGLVGTNYHVISEAIKRNYSLIVQFVNSAKKHRAEIVTWDTYYDFAVLKIIADKKEFIVLKIGNSSSLHPLDTIYVAGFPVTGAYKAQRGELNSTQTYGDRKYFDISPLIDKGNSGGPVINAQGEVVGVSVAYVPMARSINLAIRANDIKYIIEEAKDGKRKQIVREAKEIESNNSRLSANLIVHGLTIQGNLSASDQVDWFEMNGQEGSSPSFSLQYDEGCEFRLEVYSDFHLSGIIDGKSSKNPVHVPSRCFLKLLRKSGDGAYRIAVVPSRVNQQSGEEIESNNVRALANRTRSTVLYGRLDESDGEDWFELEGQEGTNPAFTLSHGNGMNFDMEVFSDDTLVCSARGSENTETIACNVPGRCYVRIIRRAGSGNYTVNVQRDGGTFAEQEPNNDRTMANLVRNLIIEGSLSNDDSEDWFELNGQEGTVPTFTIRHNSNANFDFEVFNGDALACRAIGTGSSDTIQCNVPGRCFVRIWRVNGEGNYTFTIHPNRPQQRTANTTGLEVEPNNTRETATLTSAMLLQGNLSQNDADDWFELSGQEGVMPAFIIEHGADANFDFEVFSNENLACRATAPTPTESIRCSVPGRCFIHVWRVSGEGSYVIRIFR